MFISLIVSMPALAQQPARVDLRDFQWKNRPLLVFAPTPDDTAYQDLTRQIERRRQDFDERDMVLIVVMNEGPSRVGALIAETLDDLQLRGSVMEAGLEFQVGVGGGRLSTVQRQKLALARALLKRPDLLIANEASSSMDPVVQDRIAESVLRARDGKGVVWIVNRAPMAAKFDSVVVFAEGRIAEQGTHTELLAADGWYAELDRIQRRRGRLLDRLEPTHGAGAPELAS